MCEWLHSVLYLQSSPVFCFFFWIRVVSVCTLCSNIFYFVCSMSIKSAFWVCVYVRGCISVCLSALCGHGWDDLFHFICQLLLLGLFILLQCLNDLKHTCRNTQIVRHGHEGHHWSATAIINNVNPHYVSVSSTTPRFEEEFHFIIVNLNGH